MSNNTLMYLVYGDAHEYQLELSYSVLSAMQQRAPSDDFRIVLMTDEAGTRSDLPVEHIIFSDADFARWTNNGSYKHAAKGHAYLHALDTLGGHVCMVDTDTFFLQSPGRMFDKLGAGPALMHADEGTLLNQWPGYWDRITDHYQSRSLLGYRITPRSPMFNSGVLGCGPEHRERLNDVPKLIEEMFAVDPRVHCIEQFAYTLALEPFGIETCEEVVRHYYGYERRFVHWRLAQLFPDFSEEIFHRNLEQKRNVGGFPDKHKIDLVRAKVKGLQRKKGSIYAFAFLSYLSALRAKDKGLANAWANACLDAVIWNKFPASLVSADFLKLRPEKLGGLAWLDEKTRQRWVGYWASVSEGTTA